MSMLQGNTYLMPIKICDADGGVIKGEQVEKGEFVFGDLVKFFGGDGEVIWDESREAFILPLSEDETFGFKGVVEYQGRVLLKDGSVSGSVPKSEDVYASIGTARLSDGGAGEESGEILTIRLLDRVINTGITEEKDPTVPQYVKEISEQDIENWNKVKSLGNVFKYKGSVQTYAELPTENNVVGDTYNVIEAYGDYGAGTNFAWSDNGEWDALSGLMSFNADGYVTAEEYNKLVNNEVQISYQGNSFKAGGATRSQTYGVAIGYLANDDNSYAIAIGDNTLAKMQSIAIGSSAKTDNNRGIAIGLNAKSSNKSNDIIAIGSYTQANGSSSTVIGGYAQASGTEGVAIGYKAISNGSGTIQIGDGTNSTHNSLQVFKDNIYNWNTHTATFQNLEVNGNKTYGILTGETAPTTETIGAVGQFYLDTTEKKLYQCTAVADGVYTWQAMGSGVSQEDFDKLVNNETQIKTSSNGFMAGGATTNAGNGIALGDRSEATSDGVAIGIRAKAGMNAIAIGSSSGVDSKATASLAIQLGAGTNSTQKSLQVLGDNIYKADTHTLTVQNIELNGVDLGTQLGDLNTALETILGV